jgi:hypothetical protein
MADSALQILLGMPCVIIKANISLGVMKFLILMFWQAVKMTTG